MPALAVVGKASIVIMMSSVLAVQAPLEIVHLNVFVVPIVKPVTVVVADAMVVTVAVPVCTLHAPVPVVGVLPLSCVLVALQRLMSVPAAAVLGNAATAICTSSVLGVQPPLDIVHLSVAVAPIAMPVTAVE